MNKMTVRDLIGWLQEFDPDLPVAREALEGEGSERQIITFLDKVSTPIGHWRDNITDVVLIT